MITLSSLSNTSKERKNRKRVGRGLGSGVGKTCGRGYKGAGSRSGSRRRYGYEGGQFRLYMKLPIRGFSNFKFCHRYATVNLGQIDAYFKNGDRVNIETLQKHGLLSGNKLPLKILAKGQLTKSVTIEAHAISGQAQQKLQNAKISFNLLSPKGEE